MEQAEYHLHNEAGIRFPPLRPAYSDGDIFFGRFRALISRGTGTSVIGEGGTGRIHFVRDELMDREVALKIPLDSILRDPAAREDVIEETRQAMELTHPNIVRIHDFHEAERLWGISMQFVRGKNLDEWRFHDTSSSGSRRTIRPYAVDAIRDWIAQLCDALRYAHEDARMVHRDIKPKNLMLEKREGGEKLLLTDFGITQRLRLHTMLLSRDQAKAGDNKGNMGTLPYMPWEQISGGPPSPLDDVYAVGASIYDLVTGRPPFYEGGFEQIKVQIKETMPPSMEQRLSDFGIPASHVPPEWEEVVAACLAKNPADRPQTMRELAHALGFQSGSDTTLDALVKTQKVRIRELEEKVEVLSATSAPAADPESGARLKQLERELAEARAQAADLKRRSEEAEQQMASLGNKLSLAEQQLAASGKSENEQLRVLREESGKRIAELEKQVAEERKKAREEAARETAELQNKNTALGEKLRTIEAEREKAVANTREEAEKRLKQQAEEIHRARQQIEKDKEARERLERSLATEKDRQAASIRPLLVSLAVALVLGLAGGFGYRTITATETADYSGIPGEFAFDSKNVATAPVSWGQFKAFAAALGEKPENLLVEGVEIGNDADPVRGVSWLIAQRFCAWLSALSNEPGISYTLPELAETSEPGEWSTTWKTEKEEFKTFVGFFVRGETIDKSPPMPPAHATEETTFRVKKVSK